MRGTPINRLGFLAAPPPRNVSPVRSHRNTPRENPVCATFRTPLSPLPSKCVLFLPGMFLAKGCPYFHNPLHFLTVAKNVVESARRDPIHKVPGAYQSCLRLRIVRPKNKFLGPRGVIDSLPRTLLPLVRTSQLYPELRRWTTGPRQKKSVTPGYLRAGRNQRTPEFATPL